MSVPALRFPEFEGAWVTGSLANFAAIIDGDRGENYPKADDFSDNGFCLFLNAKNVTKRGFEFDEVMFIDKERDRLLNKGKAQRSDVILTTRGSVGNFAIIDDLVLFDDIRINSGMVIVRSEMARLNPKFFYFQSFAPTLVRHIKAVAFGSAQPQLTVKEIKKFPVALPSVLEQKKIAVFLGVVDAKIAALRDRRAGLERYKRGLMQALFSQTLRFTKPDGSAFPDWEEKRLGEVAKKTASSVTAQSLETDTGEYPVYGASGYLKDISTYASEVEHISIVKDGAGVGRLFLCPSFSSVLGTLDSIVATGANHTRFVYYWLSLANFEPFVTGSTIPHIYFKDYSKLQLQLPHPDEQAKIAEALSAMDAKIAAVGDQITQMEAFKKGLLQQMFV